MTAPATCGRKFAQRLDQSVAAEGGESCDAGGKSRGTAENDGAPAARRLPENLTANHVTRPLIGRKARRRRSFCRLRAVNFVVSVRIRGGAREGAA